MKTSYAQFAVFAVAGLLLGVKPTPAQTWTQTSAPWTNWSCVASSDHGGRLAAGVMNGLIYTSTDSGASWMPAEAPTNNRSAVASSADGCRLVATVAGSGVCAWQSTPAPRLNVAPLGRNVVVSWTIPSMSFALQQNPCSVRPTGRRFRSRPCLT